MCWVWILEEIRRILDVRWLLHRVPLFLVWPPWVLIGIHHRFERRGYFLGSYPVLTSLHRVSNEKKILQRKFPRNWTVLNFRPCRKCGRMMDSNNMRSDPGLFLVPSPPPSLATVETGGRGGEPVSEVDSGSSPLLRRPLRRRRSRGAGNRPPVVHTL